MQSNHRKWVYDLKLGSKAAFEYACNLYRKELIFFAYGYIKNKPVAEEIVNDKLIRLWQMRENFETPENVRAFLYRCVRNECFDYIKKNKTEKTTEQKFALLNIIPEIRHPSEPDDKLVRKLHASIEKLPKREKQVITLYYINDLTIAEIATLLSITIPAVRNTRNRALKKLRKILAG